VNIVNRMSPLFSAEAMNKHDGWRSDFYSRRDCAGISPSCFPIKLQVALQYHTVYLLVLKSCTIYFSNTGPLLCYLFIVNNSGWIIFATSIKPSTILGPGLSIKLASPILYI